MLVDGWMDREMGSHCLVKKHEVTMKENRVFKGGFHARPPTPSETLHQAWQELDRVPGTLPSRQDTHLCDIRETEAEASPGTGPTWHRGEKMPPTAPEVPRGGCQVQGLWGTSRTYHLVNQ